MRELPTQLSEWTTAKLISDAQAEEIALFESDRVPTSVTSSGGTGPLAEAVGYVGAIIAVAAVALLLGQGWAELNLGGRLAIVGLLTVIVASAGCALRLSDKAPIQRLVSVLITGGLIGVVWMVGIVATEIAGWREDDVALVVGLATLAQAIPLYLWRRRALPQLAALVGIVVVLAAVLNRPAFASDVSWLAIAVWATGVAWALIAFGGYLLPQVLAAVTGTVIAIIGAASAAFGPARVILLTVGLMTAALVLARGVLREATYLVAIGAVGVLIFFPQVVIHLFGDSVGALVTMLVVGLMLVLLAVRLVRGRRTPRLRGKVARR